MKLQIRNCAEISEENILEKIVRMGYLKERQHNAVRTIWRAISTVAENFGVKGTTTWTQRENTS